MFSYYGPVASMPASALVSDFNGNCVGAHLITQAFYPFLLESKAEKRVLAYISSNVASIAAFKGQEDGKIKELYGIDFAPASGYSTSK